jgi:uncharacterized repeat protein (TIGR02543 family)
MKRIYGLLLGFLLMIALVACEETENEVPNDDEEVTYLISFNVHGGDMIETISVTEGSTISLPSEPNRANYRFIGWYLDATYETPFNQSQGVTENLTLHAKWEAISNEPGESTISFNSNGGSSVASITLTEGEVLPTLPIPTRDGYTFMGWYTSSTLTTLFNASTMPVNDVTLHAKWEAIMNEPDEATISFNSNGGSTVSSITQEVGSTLPPLPTPTKDGYTFMGWYTTSTLTTVFDANTMPSNNLTLYAKWETIVNEATITFNANGGSSVSPITLEVGANLNALPIPTKEGYTFMGWYVNASLTSPFNSTVMPENDQTLYAKWEAQTTPLDLLISVLIEWEFVCNSSYCVYNETSTIAYYFYFDQLEFRFEIIDHDGGSTNYRNRDELLIIDSNYDVLYTYELEEDYGIRYYTNFTLTGNALTESYRVTRYQSNYQARDTLEVEAMQRISQLMPIINLSLEEAGITFDDLK